MMESGNFKIWHFNLALVELCNSSSFSVSYLDSQFFPIILNSVRGEESECGFSALSTNVGKLTKYGILETAGSLVGAEAGNFEVQLWRTIKTVVVAILSAASAAAVLCVLGPLAEDKRISKGIALCCNL